MAQDPYQELGVGRGASAAEIRKAFHKLAKQLHPDKNPGDAKSEERFKRVSAAFDILGDDEKKKKFDRGEIDADGREAQRGYAGGSPFGGGPFAGGFRREGPGARTDGEGAEGANFDEILGEMFGRGGGAGPFGGGRGFQSKGADVRARLEIDLEDAIKGAVRRITFGDGKTLEVSIPKGAADGQTLRLRGQGHTGRSGGPAGDVLIDLVIKRHPVFRADGADLHMDLPISIPDAVLGAKVDTPTPEGVVALTVPKGSNSGARLRLKGRGGVDPDTGRRGDLFAHLVVTLPEPQDDHLVRLAERWRAERPYVAKRKE